MTNIMYLDDRKVIRHFGAHPERGKFLPGNMWKRVTVGVRWSLPKLDWEPDNDVLVRPTIALICKGKGKWEVKVEPQFREQAEQFLMDHCM